MTFEIDLNPHSFVAFMTIAAGVSYIFFNSRTGFGVVKLMTILFFVIPSVMIGNSLGHSVDIVVGAGLGFMTARRITLFNPFTRVRNHFSLLRAINKLNDKFEKQQKQTSSSSSEQNRQEEEARRRQEQARYEREQKKQQQKNQENKEQEKRNAGNNNQSYSRAETKQEQPAKKPKTPLELAYEFLGIKPTMNHADAKKRFRRMISRYHEDNMRNKDMPEWEIEEAKEKSKAVNVAWDLICKNRGWKN